MLKLPRKLTATAVGLATVLSVILMSGCGAVAPISQSNASEGLRTTLEALRDPWGLFVDPTYYDSPASIYATALIDEALGRPQSHPADVDAVVRRICSSGEKEQVGEPWFTWALTTTFGTAASACSAPSKPRRTGDANNDIPQYFAWASAQVTLGTPKDQLAEDARQLIAGIPATSRPPYVMWRADQLEDLLGLTSTAAQRVALPPTQLTGPDSLTELWGYTMRCEARPDLCTQASPIDDRAVAVAGLSYPDDLSYAGALAILKARKATGGFNELAKGVESRRIATDDLLRASRFVGSIDASFAVLELAPSLFPGDSPEATSQQLQQGLELVPATDTVKRLRTLALLKAVDPAAWKKREGEVRGIYQQYQGKHVDQAAMVKFIDVATAFGVMGLDAPTAHLDLFEANSPESIYHARVAAGSNWAFTNGNEVLTHFQAVRESALDTAASPSEPVVSYIAGLSALNGPGLDIAQERRAAIAVALNSALKGCEFNGHRAEGLYRFNINKGSGCSLTITVDAINSSFGG